MDDYLMVASKKYKKLRIDNFFSGVNTRLDQSVLPPATAAEIYNFDFSSGALRDGIGLKDGGVSALFIKHIWRFSTADGDILMLCRAGGEIFYKKCGDGQGGVLGGLAGVSATGNVTAAEYTLHGRNVIVICSDESPIVVWDGQNPAYSVADSPRTSCMGVHEGLTFLAESGGLAVRYTYDPDPTNWNESLSEGGVITFNDGLGRVNKMVSFLGNLYAFRDFGISKISISGGVPKPTGVFSAGGRIVAATVAQCGNKTLFLAEDGLYEFDGLSAKRALCDLDGFIVPRQDATACWSGGRYYLAVRAEGSGVIGCESGEYKNNALLSYDLQSGEYSIGRGMDISCMTSAGGDTYAVMDGKVFTLAGGGVSGGADGTGGGMIDGVPLAKCWRSAHSDFGSEKTKILKEVHLQTAGDIRLTVFSENGQRTREVAGSDIPQKVRLNMRGKKLSLQIESDTPNANISRVVLVYSEV